MKSIRNGSKLRRKDATLKQFASNASFQFGDRYNESMTFSDIYQSNVLETSVLRKLYGWMIVVEVVVIGNMKRRLSTCHGLQDDDLKDGRIDKLKYKEIANSRLKSISRSKHSKNLQYLKVTQKLAKADVNNDPSSSTIDYNALNVLQVLADVTPSTFQSASSFDNCDEELSLLVINLSNSSSGMEVKPNESLSERTETLSNDNNSNESNNKIECNR